MNLRSIKFRLAAWYAGLLTVGFLLIGYSVVVGVKFYLERTLGETQMRRARQIASGLVMQMTEHGAAQLSNEVNSLYTPAESHRFIRISRSGGNELYRSPKPADDLFNPASVAPARFESAPAYHREFDGANRELLVAVVPCHATNGLQYQVEVGASLEPIQEVLHHLVMLLGGGLILMLLIATGGGYFLLRKALAPVDQLARSAEQISLHHLPERLPLTGSRDELDRLAASLNQMIGRLEESLDQNRRFIADASHELRTPLTIIRGELEGIFMQEQPLEEIKKISGSALEEVDRLSQIVEGLFALSRLDAGEAQRDWLCFDLAHLATTTADQLCLLAEDKGIKITAIAKPVWVEGDRARIKQVIVNLLDNAIKYTPADGAIELRVFDEAGQALLEVEDNGIGISDSAQPHIFERFFRADSARSRAVAGAGLGLSIVKAICNAHGGKISVESKIGVGSRFRISLPLLPARPPQSL